jgi:ZIP family zinc transporter
VGEAFLWGALGASALLIGALVAYLTPPSRNLLAFVMALGSGLLIGSVAFELIDDAVTNKSVWQVGAMTLVGAAVFTAGDWYLDRRGGGERKDSSGAQSSGTALAIVLGSVLDGIPESFVLGLTVRQGGVSVALLAGILLSNLPEGMSSSSGLKVAGWPLARIVKMWVLVVIVSAASAAIGYVVLGPGSGRTGAMVESFAAGALLSMVCSTMLPEAFEVEGVFTGACVVFGFAIALVLSAI